MAELKNDFSWSKSRANVFDECPRKYFFQYYGFWNGWDRKTDKRTRTIYVLKQLQSRHQWVGATVHNCLHWVLTTLRKTGTPPPEETALRNLVRRLNTDYQESGEGLYWDEPKKHCALIEHEYEDLDVPDEEWQGVMGKAARCVSTFYQSDILKTLQTVPRDQWLEMEELTSFNLDDTKIWVQLDCAHRDGDGIRIYDWKTGKADTEHTRDQLALYTLYAASKWNLTPDKIRTVEFNLATNEVFEHSVSTDELIGVRQRMIDSTSAMLALTDDPKTNAAREDRFELTENQKTCTRCNFLRVCPRGQINN